MGEPLTPDRLRLALLLCLAAEVLMVVGVLLRGGGAFWLMALGPPLAALTILAIARQRGPAG